MANHTPAPWTFDGKNIDAASCGHKDGICTMLFTNDFEVNELVTADAHLIAAAPDMFDALMELHRVVFEMPVSDTTDYMLNLIQTTLDAATPTASGHVYA